MFLKMIRMLMNATLKATFLLSQVRPVAVLRLSKSRQKKVGGSIHLIVLKRYYLFDLAIYILEMKHRIGTNI